MSNISGEIAGLLEKTVKIVLSEPTDSEKFDKIIVKPVEIKGERRYQSERFRDKKVFHLNLKRRIF